LQIRNSLKVGVDGCCGYSNRLGGPALREANSKNKDYQFWQQENHPIELISNKFIDQKLDYIHKNPVKAGLVDEPWEYRYTSARDYMNDQKGLLEVELICARIVGVDLEARQSQTAFYL
jgi:hypothetical protein